MSRTSSDHNFWTSIARLRQQQIESGSDLTFTRVFVPYFAKAVRAAGGSRLIEVGCGTGHMLLALHSLVQYAAGIDSSRGMVDVARETLRETNAPVILSRIEDLFTSDKFDIAISHLSLQAIEDLSSVVRATRRLLTLDGHFVFSIPHPCFWNSYQHFVPDDEYDYMNVTRVIAPLSVRGEFVGMVPYMHRPLSEYFRILHNAQLSVSLLDEIVPEPEIELLYGERWVNPRYAVFHCTLRR